MKLQKGWHRTRLDRVASVNARIGWRALTAAEYQDEGYAFLATPNIKPSSIDFEDVNFISKFRFDESPELKLQTDDVLLAKDGSTLGIVNVVRDLPRPATVNGSIAVIRPAAIHGPFLRYALQSAEIQGRIQAFKDGMGVPHLFQWDINRFPLVVPEVSEQRAIADYLDAETARIDALITKKQQLIYLLEERWASLVDYTTSIGGKVRVRHVTSLRTSGPRGWGDKVGNVGSPFVRSANLNRKSTHLDLTELGRVVPPDTAEAKRSMTKLGDTVVGITGANTGWVGLVEDDAAGGFVSQHVAILRPSKVEPLWLTYSLFAPRAQGQLLGGQYGGTKTQLGLNDLGELQISVPSNEEQSILISQLNEERSARLALLEGTERQIDLLSERRQALITAAVTGEFTVPGVA